MKIKTLKREQFEELDSFDSRINEFIDSVRMLDIMAYSVDVHPAVTVVYEDKSPYNGSLVNKKY
ncbi:hypothetical protein U5S90_04565 [Streptococcus agalactiae]|uniref:hypothetical protein n=1 Tax=Streptococcus agalactiae TaxID=1311 RepID=UPI00137505A9|nr:hypothetical protein [Streptococcus agalactiae]KAF1128138.1 hypothetical protein B8U92_02950 [Streptococcus agalactiae]MCD0020575.1 hypothetical protein [Streptococcus agalactiae]HEN9895409.1 hypothetical protein [Streptococcus agalactiae]